MVDRVFEGCLLAHRAYVDPPQVANPRHVSAGDPHRTVSVCPACSGPYALDLRKCSLPRAALRRRCAGTTGIDGQNVGAPCPSVALVGRRLPNFVFGSDQFFTSTQVEKHQRSGNNFRANFVARPISCSRLNPDGWILQSTDSRVRFKPPLR